MDNGESSYRRFIEGDQSAFDELMDAYRDRLIFFIKGYVRSAEEAQDIAMDTFVEILVHPGRFRFKSSFKTYIYSVARHKAIDFLRKKRTVSDEGEDIWDESAIDSFTGARTRKLCASVWTDSTMITELCCILSILRKWTATVRQKLWAKAKSSLPISSTGRSRRLKPSLKRRAFAMKTDKEFKNEVYARASKERARIKKRNRVIMTAVPCFVIALTAATAAVYHQHRSL